MSTARVGDVLRIRRHNTPRIEGFVDASFALAVALPGPFAEAIKCYCARRLGAPGVPA